MNEMEHRSNFVLGIRLRSLLLAVGLALASASCSGGTSTVVRDQAGAPSPVITPAAASAPAEAPVASPSAAAAADPIATSGPTADVIRQAYRQITGQLFRAVTPRELLAPAWQAVMADARRQGVDANTIQSTPADLDDIDTFVREFDRFTGSAGGSVDGARLGQVAVRAMASAVGDSHTRFLTPEQAENQRRSADGDTAYSGIGIRLEPLGGAFTIAEVYSNTPAARAGLQAGDRIVRVNGRETTMLDLNGFSAQVRGPEGSEVRLTIQRSDDTLQDISLNRSRIALPVVTSRMLDAATGYIKIASLPRRSTTVDAAREFDEQLRVLVEQGARGVVLDLRGNPGGDPFTSVAVASNFVPDGPIFISVNREGRRTTYPATTRPTLFRGPLAVLIDRGTASGAEVIASAVQEYGAGHLLGTRTCGCLSVGRPLQLGDSSGLIVTVEQALTGRQERSIEGIGLAPDQSVTADLSGRDLGLNRALSYLRSQTP